jgi:hypothetical protein
MKSLISFILALSLTSMMNASEYPQTLEISYRHFKARADQLLPYSYTRTNGGMTWAFWRESGGDFGIFATLSGHKVQDVTYQFHPETTSPSDYSRPIPIVSSLFRILLPSMRPNDMEIRAALNKAQDDDKPVEWRDGRVKIFFRFKHGSTTHGEGEYDWMRVEIGPPNYVVSDDK